MYFVCSYCIFEFFLFDKQESATEKEKCVISVHSPPQIGKLRYDRGKRSLLMENSGI